MNQRTKNQPSALSGRSLPLPAEKTRPRVDGITSEGHSYKPLPKKFRRDGFEYRRIAREGDAALYEQRWTRCAEPSVCYEVIHVRQREGFQIQDRFVKPFEAYPSSKRWGVRGFTFVDKDTAFAKLRQLANATARRPGRRGRRRCVPARVANKVINIWSQPYPGESDNHFEVRMSHRYLDMPEAFLLHGIGWQLMGHATFPCANIARAVRTHAFTATLRRTCKCLRIYYPKVFWALCHELGTRDDLSPHLHFLIASVPRPIDLEKFRRVFQSHWRRQTGGISQVLLYDRELGGAAYIAKYTCTECRGSDCGPTLSKALWKYLKRLVTERGAPSTRPQKFCDE
jgi:hypothetical protein